MNTIMSDSGAITYDAPHWLDDDGDGDAGDTSGGDRRYPILYACSKAVEASAKFIVGSVPQGLSWKVKATTSDRNISFNAVTATLSGRELSASVKSSRPLPWRANFYDPLTINW